MSQVLKLEMQIRQLQEEISTTKLTQSSSILLISRIYQIAACSSTEDPAIRTIMKLIEENNQAALSQPDFTTRLESINASGSLTPPKMFPDVILSTFSSLGACTAGEESAETSEHKSISSVLSSLDARGRTQMEESSPASIKCKANITMDDEDVWQEFSLEEELEGITEAPVKERTALRAALQEKELAHKKMLQASAEEIRKIAELEGHRIQLSLRKTKETPLAYSKSFQNPVREKSKVEHEEESKDGPGAFILNLDDSPKKASFVGVKFDPIKASQSTPAGDSRITGSDGGRRSVLFQNIPAEFNTHKFLAYVRGGTIVAATMTPEMFRLGNGQTALIVFSTEEEARTCSQLSNEVFWRMQRDAGTSPRNNHYQIRATHLPSPTYPKESVPFQRLVTAPPGSRMSQQTRCLIVQNFPKKYTNELCTEIRLNVHHFPNKIGSLEEMWFDGDTLHINFTSIRESVRAYEAITYFYFGKFSTNLQFAPDPCALSLTLHPGYALEANDFNVASFGHVGLKSLIETVGLAVYSQSYRKIAANEAKTYGRNSSHGGKFDEDGGKADRKVLQQLIKFSTSEEQGNPESTSVRSPWTEDLMVGLDLL